MLPKNVLILSPHCDDIPLSLGGALLTGFFGPNVHVVVVFSVSRYTKDKMGNAHQRLTTAKRTEEEKKAASIAKYSVSFLGFGEPFARPGFNHLDEICVKKRNPKSDPVWKQVNTVLHKILRKHEGITVSPLGYGYHIDHKIVSLVIREYCSLDENFIPVFFEDLPYAAHRDQKAISS